MATGRSWTAVLRGIAVLGALTAVAAITVAALWWRHEGGRWYVVTSASMGQAAPIGSLLLTRPTTVATTPDGAFITFTSPDSHKTFSHRVVRHDLGGLTTQGDANLVEDAWLLHDQDLLGRVVWHTPALGWAVRAVPLLALGGAATWLLTASLGAARRRSWRTFGASLTVSLVGWWLHPWVGVEKLTQTTPDDGSGGVLLRVISTGLLPIRVSERGGEATARLTNGQIETLHLTHATDGTFDVGGHLALGLWGWVGLVLVVASPTLWTLLRGAPDAEPQPDPEPAPDPAPDDVVAAT